MGSGRLRAAARPPSLGADEKEELMIRIFALIAGLALIGATAGAQSTLGESDDARYTFNRVDDGYLRLDGRTGQVSLCTRQSVGWACRIMPDERAALEAEISRLQGEIVALKKELIARNLPLPGGIKPEPSAKPEEPRLRLPNDADVNKIINFLEKVWRRLVEMVATLQREMLRKT
jgi:hypothetical protein